MQTLADIEKDQLKKKKVINAETGIEDTTHAPIWKNKKFVITALVGVGLVIGGYIVYKKVLVKKPQAATTATF
jgi:hypothetical protein